MDLKLTLRPQMAGGQIVGCGVSSLSQQELRPGASEGCSAQQPRKEALMHSASKVEDMKLGTYMRFQMESPSWSTGLYFSCFLLL